MKSYTFPLVLLIITLTASLTGHIAKQTQIATPDFSVISLGNSNPAA